MRKLVSILLIIVVSALGAHAANNWSIYGPGNGLGGAPDLGHVRSIQELQARYQAKGGKAWAIARLNEAIRLEPGMRAAVSVAMQRYRITQAQWVNDAAVALTLAIQYGKVSRARYPVGQRMLIVSSAVGPSTRRQFVYQPHQAAMADYWALWVEAYDVDLSLSFPVYCGNFVLLAAGYRTTPPPPVTTPTPPPPGVPFQPMPPSELVFVTEGPKAGFHMSQNGSMAQAPPPNVFIPKPPETKITVNGSTSSSSATAPTTVNGSTSSSTSSATGGAGGAGAAAPHGTITIGPSTVSTATTVTGSGAVAVTGGAGGGPAAGAVDTSGASGASGTVGGVTITF